MQSTFFRLVRAGLKVILAIGIGVLVFLAVCFIARRYEAEETKRFSVSIGMLFQVRSKSKAGKSARSTPRCKKRFRMS